MCRFWPTSPRLLSKAASSIVKTVIVIVFHYSSCCPRDPDLGICSTFFTANRATALLCTNIYSKKNMQGLFWVSLSKERDKMFHALTEHNKALTDKHACFKGTNCWSFMVSGCKAAGLNQWRYPHKTLSLPCTLLLPPNSAHYLIHLLQKIWPSINCITELN